ncbi:MAG: Ig-like domain-containing protein, partial [Bifidobacteriaceae bacterium]|nr:Ig-like domain-containing protein [Bifidobacteriaceae bacterium]
MLNYVSILAGNNYQVYINTFPGEQRYLFDLNGNYGVLEGRVLLDLVESQRAGGLVPDAVGLEAYTGGSGAPIVPPYLTFKGGGFYLYNLAKTIDWDNWKLIPPLYVESKLRLGVMELMDVDSTMRIGLDHIGLALEASVGGPEELGMDFLSLSPASASFDVSWAGAADPDNPEFAKVDASGEFSWYLLPWYRKYAGGMSVGVKKNTWPDFAGYLEGDFGIVGFKVPVINLKVGGWSLGDYRVYVSNQEAYASVGLLGKMLRFKLGTTYRPLDPYADVQWDIGIASGDIHLMADRQPQVGDSISGAQPLIDKDGNQIGVIDLGGAWQLVGQFGYGQAQLAPSLGVQPAANSAALGLMAPQAVPMQVPETSYELTPIERDGDHGHLVGVNGLTGDNLEVFYDKDGVAGGGDWVAYQLVWERPTTDPKAAPATKEELADQSVNAMDFSGQTFQNDDGTTEPGSVLVMLNETLSPLWKIAAKDGATTFEASQVETDPLAGLAGAQWDGSAKKLTVQTENLTDPDTGAFKTGQYRLNAVVDAADGSGQTATVATAVPVTSSAPAVLDLAAGLAALPAGLPSGDYTVSAILEESSKDAEGNTVWGPIDDARADGVYSHRNPLDPVSVGSFSDQPAVAPAGDGVLEISWTGAQDADTQYEVKALNPDGSEYLFPTERIPEVDEDGNPVLDADGNQVVTASQPAPAAWSATSGQHQDPATGRYTLRVGNLDPGKAYKIAITPVRTVGEGLQLRGPAWTSEAVGLPMPNPASIALAYRGATEVVDDVTGDSTVFANGDYTMELAFGQAVVWEVKSGQTVLQSGQTAAAREPVEVTVPASAASAANWITVSAKNAAGDWSFREFTSNFSDATPALFVDADVDGCVYVDGNNEFTVTGLTVPGYTVAVRTAGVAEVTADEYGVFSLTADADGVPAAEGARWVTVTVQDAAGNMASQMVQLVGTNDPPATGPGLSRLEADPEPALAGSGAARSVTARVTEKNGIPLPGVDVVFTVPDGLKHVPALGAPVPGPVDVTVPTDLAGVAKIDVTADSPGTRGVTATADGLAITQGSPAVPLFVAPAYFVDAAASQLTIPTAAGGAAKVPNGWDSHTAQAVVVNLEGDLLVDAPVTFEIKESPGSTPYYRYATTDQNGVATIQFASTWEATFKISARVSSQLIAGSPADAEFAWGDPDLMEGTRLSGEWAWADGSSEATVSAYVVNAEGTALSGVDVLFYIPAGVSAGGTSGPATVTDTTDQWGLASVGLSSTAPGSYEVTATIDGQPITRGSPAVAGFLPPPALSGDHDGSVLTIPTAQGGATKLANGLDAHRAEVLVQSAAGVPAPGVDVMFEASYPGAYGEGGTVGTSVISDQNGVATFEFVSLEEAEWSITAAIISSDGDRWLGLSGSPQTAQFAGGAPAGPVPLVPYVNPTNGKAVSGGPSMDQRQQMDKVERAVVADFASGAELGRADLDQIGEFDIALDPPAADGTVLAVWLEGPAGEKGTPALVVVDAVPPSLIVTANDGNPVTGWAPGANFNIEVIDGDGQVIGYGNVGPDWSFEAPTYHAAGVGDLVTVRALDQAGNTVEAVWRLGLPEVQVVPASAAPAGEVGVVGVNFQPGEDVTAVLEPGGALVGSARADQNGGVSFGWSVPATEAPGTLSVALTGTRSGEQTGAFAVSGDPADPAASQLSIPSAAGGAFRLADGLAQHRAQVQVLDVSGAAMPGVNVRFAWSRPDGASGVETARSGADGVAEWAFSSVDEVTYTVSATIDGITVGGAPGTAEFRGHPPATGFGLSRLEAQGGWAPADGASTRSVTAWATDGRGDPLPGASIAFLVPPGTRVGLVDGPASVTVTADGAGRADVSLTSQAAGTYAVNAVVTTQYGSVQITEGAPAAVVFTVPPAPPGTQADPGNSALAIPTAAGGATVRADGVEAHRAEVSLLTAG